MFKYQSIPVGTGASATAFSACIGKAMAVDRAYVNLLSHFQRPKSGISTQTVISAIPYYLAQLPLPHPTQLTAFVISSSLWHPLSVNTVGVLVNGYSYAVRLKEANIQNEVHGWFAREPQTLLGEWAAAVMKGASRGNPQLRIAILGGLLLGCNGLGHDSIRAGVQNRLESQVVIACAELLDAVLTPGDPESEDVGERESLLLYSAYNILPCVPTEKVAALDILALIRLAEKGVEKAFASGQFLSRLSSSITRNPEGQISISPESSLMRSLQTMNSSILYKDISHLAKLLSRCLSLLADQKPLAAWDMFQGVSQGIEAITFSVEKDWKQSPLAALTSEQDLDREARESSTEIWKVLKNLLFSHLVISQSILSSIQYLQPVPAAQGMNPNSSSVASSILRSLHHLSFVISQFGGIAASAEGLKELKRVCYMALDIVAADPDSQRGATFIKELISHAQESPFVSAHPFRQSQTAYMLVIVEQLMSTLPDSMIEDTIVPFCHSYLTEPEHRETYESAHSVMLSIFTAHSQHNTAKLVTKSSLAERLIPFYVDLLLQGSAKGRLNTSQVKTAYSSLVRSVASSKDDVVTWFCIDALLTHLDTHASPPSDQLPLYLALTSLISCVPLSLLSRLLSEVEKAFNAVDNKTRAELGKVVLEEITQKVGDCEKEMVLSWWCRVAPTSISTLEDQAI